MRIVCLSGTDQPILAANFECEAIALREFLQEPHKAGEEIVHTEKTIIRAVRALPLRKVATAGHLTN
jgi:hypothetical protein